MTAAQPPAARAALYDAFVSRARLFGFTLGSVLVIGALVAGAFRIDSLARAELQHEGALASLHQRSAEPGATRISARLTEVELAAGELATFEVCAMGDLGAERYDEALDFVVWREMGQKLELKVSLDVAHRALVKRENGASCLTLGGGRVAETTRYALDAVWAGRRLSPELSELPLRARVLAKRPLRTRDGVLVLCAALGAVLCVLSAFAHSGQTDALPRRRGLLWAFVFGALSIVAFTAALHVPLAFSLGGLSRGLAVGALEVSLAVVGARLSFLHARKGLCLFAPHERAGAWLFTACLAALVLRVLSHWSLRLVPSTGRAPIETFISWPSGALSFALLGMVVPLAEELFFRGFIYGTLRTRGQGTALLGSIAFFTAAHAQQAWGNWGVLVSVTLTGAVLTLLRALSGSTLVPAVAHVLFNLSLWRDSFSA